MSDPKPGSHDALLLAAYDAGYVAADNGRDPEFWEWRRNLTAASNPAGASSTQPPQSGG